MLALERGAHIVQSAVEARAGGGGQVKAAVNSSGQLLCTKGPLVVPKERKEGQGATGPRREESGQASV